MNAADSNSTGTTDFNLPTLYDLFRSLKGQATASGRCKVVEMILLHPELHGKQRNACRAVLKRWEKHHDLQAELMQQTSFRLVEFFAVEHSTYVDTGPEEFQGWIWMVVLMATRRAWTQCRPLWLKRKSLPRDPPIRRMAVWPEVIVDWEDVKIAISQIKDQLRREIIDEWSRGYSMTESSRLHQLSYADVRKRRKQGAAELRRILLAR